MRLWLLWVLTWLGWAFTTWRCWKLARRPKSRPAVVLELFTLGRAGHGAFKN